MRRKLIFLLPICLALTLVIGWYKYSPPLFFDWAHADQMEVVSEGSIFVQKTRFQVYQNGIGLSVGENSTSQSWLEFIIYNGWGLEAVEIFSVTQNGRMIRIYPLVEGFSGQRVLVLDSPAISVSITSSYDTFGGRRCIASTPLFSSEISHFLIVVLDGWGNVQVAKVTPGLLAEQDRRRAVAESKLIKDPK